MSANATAIPKLGIERAVTNVLSVALAPLLVAFSAPVLIFLVALAAMLFRSPALKAFPLDRVAFFVLISIFALRFCLRREHLEAYSATWPMLGLTLLAFWGVLKESDAIEAWSVLAAKWIVPVVLFHIAGSVFRDQSSLRKLELFSLAALSYLTLVSVLFLLDAKFLILPRFILDESLGIHADRARGPFLQAVANGVCLNILGLVALDSFRRRRLRGIVSAALFVTVPLALLATRTRAVWLSAGLSIILLASFSRDRRVRRPALAIFAMAAVALCSLLVYDGDTAALRDRLWDRSPVDFRLDMYKAGWQMFTEKPLAGWGSEADIQPEIEKRITAFRPERYVFHNSYLELAVERGIIGLGLYAWLMICFFRLARSRSSDREAHFIDGQFRQLWPFILGVYLLNASAVVMSYQFVNGYLFTLAGIMSAQDARRSPVVCVRGKS